MNKAILIGNLTKDPELTNAKDISICKFTIAVNRGYGDKKQTDFLPIVTFRGQADNCGKFIKKGSTVGVSGCIQTRTYEANDGTKRYVTEIVADEVKFLSTVIEQQEIPDLPEQNKDLPF